MKNMVQILKERYNNNEIDYDAIYSLIEGWVAYAKNANTHKMRKKILADFESEFPNEISTKEINRHLRIQKKENYASCTNAGKRHGIHPTDMSEIENF